MLSNYIKTSARNIVRNKLFSSITIFGLAISMSVGLLLIAFVLDLHTYDKFHAHGDRIYRITNITNAHTGEGNKFATTSIKSGKLIREKVAGVEEVVIVQSDFSADAKFGDYVVPIKGFWAESSLFRIFTYPMLEGNPETALKEPYTIVLTETAANKLFGTATALGKAIQFDGINYQVTGVMKDVPFFSHTQFEALVSFSTLEQINKTDATFDAWTNMTSTYVYLLKEENAEIATIQSQLDVLAKEENRTTASTKIQLELLPLYNIVVGENLSAVGGNGPHVAPIALWILGGLALLVILSACFNYTILTIARAMRRFKEIGLRKAIGAGKQHIRHQFITEAILISLIALSLSVCIFLFLRPQLIGLAPEMQNLVKLELSFTMVIAFIIFSIVIGTIAGFLPALFFSKTSAIHALKTVSTVKVFHHLPLRQALVVVQYSLTIIFITATAIGYVQYKNILAFDLGFQTENVLNINMQGNTPNAFIHELSKVPEVMALSKSMIVTSVGNAWGGYMKYKDSHDSTLVLTNHVDENYLDLHNYELLAGTNFMERPTAGSNVNEMIVNEQVLKRFNIANGDPVKAIGEEITFSNFRHDGRRMTIVGVMKDFHYGKLQELIEPVAFIAWTPEDRALVNVKIKSANLPSTMAKIQAVWKKIDPIHPFQAQFYDDEIENAYSELSIMIKIIGFLSFLAISIASMGLFGMVALTTETRLKEIGIRKVLGSGTGQLILLLSRGFLVLLAIAALIALPLTYLFFENVVLIGFPYHTRIQAPELFGGLLVVLFIACILIGSQTIQAARKNPVAVLKSE